MIKKKIDQHIVVQTYFLCISVYKQIFYNKSHLSMNVLQDMHVRKIFKLWIRISWMMDAWNFLLNQTIKFWIRDLG